MKPRTLYEGATQAGHFGGVSVHSIELLVVPQARSNQGRDAETIATTASLFEIEVWRFVNARPQIEPKCRRNEDGMSLDEDEVWLFSIDVPLYELEWCPVALRETTFELAQCLFEAEVCLSKEDLLRDRSVYPTSVSRANSKNRE
jgi:hypothetical protein